MRTLALLLISAQVCFGQVAPSARRITSPVFVTAGGGSSTLNTGLISYWKLDEASGTRVDSEPTGTAQDLTDNNTVTSTTGKISNAGQFTRANSERLTRADSADLSTGDIDFTIAAWVYADSLGAYNFIVMKGGSTTDDYSLDITDGNKPRFYIKAAPSTFRIAESTVSITTGTWYFIVGWHDAAANTVNVQVDNGTIYSTATSGSIPIDSTDVFAIGAYGTSFYFNGRIDEVGFWKKVLTTDEKTELYNAGSGKTCCPF